jgi:hypothetical protein
LASTLSEWPLGCAEEIAVLPTFVPLTVDDGPRTAPSADIVEVAIGGILIGVGYDGARLEDVLDRTNTASEVYADTAYRSAKNEEMLSRRGFVSRIHRKKPMGKPMPGRTRIATAQKSKVRSVVEHVFAHQKGLMGDGPLRSNNWPGAGAAQDRALQSRLQHAPLRLPTRARSDSVKRMRGDADRRPQSGTDWEKSSLSVTQRRSTAAYQNCHL